MNRRGRIPGVLVVVLALAVVLGSGAFTAVSAERGVTVEVVGDADSVIGLAPHEGPNGRYAYVDDGLLVVDVSSTNPNDVVRGVGKRTTTRFDGVFDVTNHGAQPVRVWIDHDSTAVAFYTTTEGHGSIDGEENAVWIRPGSGRAVGLVVDSRGAAVGDVLLDRVRINAAAEGADAPDPDPDTDPTPDLPDPDPIPDPGPEPDPDPEPTPVRVPSIIVGAPHHLSSSTSEPGKAYIVTSDVSGTVSLVDADATFTGEANGDEAGRSVAVAGDVNGDGGTDYLVGAPKNDEGGTDAGAVYVVYGPESGTFNLSNADVKLVGPVPGDEVGRSVVGAGDVNGDGFDDILVGAPFKATSTGGAFLVYGSASLNGTVNLADADAKFRGGPVDVAGWSVAGAGDVNGDGFDDILVGATHVDDPTSAESGVGAAYLVYGSASLAGSMDIGDANATFLGEDAVDLAGTSVAGAGDVNGDGFDDVLVGAPNNDHDGGLFGEGAAYLIYGGSGTDAPNGTQNLSTAAVKFLGEGDMDRAGSSVAGAGDVNGDGYDDVLVGAPLWDTVVTFDKGTVYLVYGSESLAATIELADADVLVRGEDGGDSLGDQVATMAGVGDIDGDGFGDFVVASRAHFPESVYLFHGGSLSGIISASSADTILLEDDNDDQADTSVAGGT